MEVLFVLGKGRSGTTLLGQVLDTFPGVFFAGELKYLWWGVLEGQPCSCGLPGGDCPLWSTVLDRLLELDSERVTAFGPQGVCASRQEIRREYAKWMLSTQQAWNALQAVQSRFRPSKQQFLYLQSVSRLYDCLADVTGAPLIINSGKQLSDPGALGLLPNVQASIVHMVRDPRGVALSWQSRKQTPDGRFMQRKSIRHSAVTWLVKNAGLDLMRAVRPTSGYLRYEDFVKDPEGAAGKLLSALGLSIGDIEPDRYPWNQPHVIAGNPSRFTQKNLNIAVDDRWQRQMRSIDRLLVTSIDWPLMIRYGYALRTVKHRNGNASRMHRFR